MTCNCNTSTSRQPRSHARDRRRALNRTTGILSVLVASALAGCDLLSTEMPGALVPPTAEQDPALPQLRVTTISANSRVARLAEWFGAEAVGTRRRAPWLRERGRSEVEWCLAREDWPRRAGR